MGIFEYFNNLKTKFLPKDQKFSTSAELRLSEAILERICSYLTKLLHFNNLEQKKPKEHEEPKYSKRWC